MLHQKRTTAKEKELLAKAKMYLPGGTLGNAVLPTERSIVFHSAKGSHLYDVSGNEYIDYLLGSGPMILGHAHPSVTEAVTEAVTRGSTFFAISDVAIELAETLVNAIPCADQVRFTTSGTDANFQCLRLARAFRGREKILKFEGGYHGTSDYAVMSSSPGLHAPPFPTPSIDSPGVPKQISETVLVAPFNNLQITASLIEEHHDELAAVILEPFQRVLSPREGFLEGIREITAHYQIPLIFDEVVTGFRFAYGGAQEYYGVVPDLAAYGKIIGGGYPLAAIAGREELMNQYDPDLRGSPEFVPQLGTLSGNPVSAAAGLATLKELQTPGVYQKLFSTGTYLKESLGRLLDESEIPARLVGVGPLFDVFFTDQEISDYRDTLKADTDRLRRFHTLLLENGIFKSLQKFYVSLAHTEGDIARTLEVFSSTIEQLDK
jgi:glutamate-1-semialdehyde 2,1-aminomutase